MKHALTSTRHRRPRHDADLLRGSGFKPAFDPFRQGDLDSLCGMYAIINALSALCPEIDEDNAIRLFGKLAAGLADHSDRPLGTVWNGMSQATLEALLAAAQHELERLAGIKVRSRPFRLREKHPTLGALWDELRAELSRRQVAILGIDGVKDHWTVAYGMTEKLMKLHDSNERTVLFRSRCTLQDARTRFKLVPKAIILVRRAT